jgi:hypothetical protein
MLKKFLVQFLKTFVSVSKILLVLSFKTVTFST